jgi:hypothetical protein
MAKMNYQKAKERARARAAFAQEVRQIMMTPPPGWENKGEHLHLKCKRCAHEADLIIPRLRIVRGVTVRCSQCGAKRKL